MIYYEQAEASVRTNTEIAKEFILETDIETEWAYLPAFQTEIAHEQLMAIK